VTTASPQRTLWLTLGAMLALCFTIGAGIHLVGWSVGSVSKNEHHVLPGTVKEVRIDGAFSDLELAPSSGDQVVVDSHASGSLWLPKMRTSIDGDHVSVSGDCHFVVIGTCGARFVVHVPAGMPVTVSTGSGDVRADGLSGPVALDVSSGDLDLHALTGGTTAQVRSGDIFADALSGRLTLRASSGDIHGAELRSRDVSARATSGDVVVDSEVAPDRVDAAASSGDVTVAVPRGVTYDATVDASSGDHFLGVASDPASDHHVSAVTSSGDASLVYR
jgi:DUF4097 and DUF4098 domain-containing protein YvlB